MPSHIPAELLAGAAQRIRQGDHRIDIALRGPLAAWLDDAEHRVRSAVQAAAEVWPDDPDHQSAFTARQQPEAALDFARAVLGQDNAPAATDQHLWELDHPYYGAEGYLNECESWAEFAEHIAPHLYSDLNHLYRWDWHKPGHHEWEGEEELGLFFIMPRKSSCMSYTIPVTEADEPAVRAYLADMTKHVAALWEPITIGPTT
ncbi:hypothetical protein [Kitasatospora sp. NPDC058046]|uniref:hypothetical protein n=1 Tax=Kitasatospora sp. NPDC058046 TaxID=3346312 RepID=UPI0036D9DF52